MKLPKTEQTWVQAFTPNGDFVITSDLRRLRYTLWQLLDGDYLKVKTADSPAKFQDYLDSMWAEPAKKKTRKRKEG